jgi:hypothetical protein
MPSTQTAPRSRATNITQSNGDVTVTFNAASAGTVYLGIKYDSTSVKGFTPPSGNGTAHYTFQTTGQANTTQGLDLNKNYRSAERSKHYRWPGESRASSFLR